MSKVPKTIQDIHYRLYLDLLELRGAGIALRFSEEPELLRAVESLTKGKVRFLGFYDSFYTEQSKMVGRVQQLLKNKDRVFKFIYTLPGEDGFFLVSSKVRINLWDPWRERE